MKNEYEIRGDTTAIFIDSRRYGRIETLIATTDLQRVREYEGTWGASWCTNSKNYYINGSIRVDNSRKKIKLHRWVMRVDDPKVQVDHIFHDTLDNCHWALRLVTNRENAHNRRNKSNTGHRGVYWREDYGKWRVRIRSSSGKQINIGHFDSLDEAISARIAAEKEHLPHMKLVS